MQEHTSQLSAVNSAFIQGWKLWRYFAFCVMYIYMVCVFYMTLHL